MAQKEYHEMSDAELRDELATWEGHVKNAGGWASAYFAAKQLEAVVYWGNQRGLGFVNNYPIKVG